MDNPRFSVIVPAHNSSAFIRKGLDSIRNQSFQNYELIIVCDNCSDNTAKIASEYANVLLETDYGRDGMARNEGLNVAKGEWILFMDDDDWWLHEYAFHMIDETLKLEEMDILGFAFIWKHVGFTKNTVNHLWIATWNKCWKRSAIGDTRFGEDAWGADVVFHEEMMKKPLKAVVWDQPLYYYNYMREGSQTYNRDIQTMHPLDAGLKKMVLEKSTLQEHRS